MLVSYHRPYDAKLLLLAIPAVSMLNHDDRWHKLALAVSTLAVFFTSDLPLAFLAVLVRSFHFAAPASSARVLLLPILRPAPLALLLMAVVFLWVYLRPSKVESPEPILAPRGPQ